MTRTELLLTVLSEECTEVGQRACKAIRFGLNEVQEGQEKTNAERLIYEFNDLLAVMYQLKDDGLIDRIVDPEMIRLKREKMDKWIKYSNELGIGLG